MNKFSLKGNEGWAATSASAAFALLFLFWANGLSKFQAIVYSIDKSALPKEHQDLLVSMLSFFGNAYIMGVLSILFGLWAMLAKFRWQGVAALPFIGLSIYVFILG